MKITDLSPGEMFVTDSKPSLGKIAPRHNLLFKVSPKPDQSHNAIHVGFHPQRDSTVRFGDGAKVLINPSIEVEPI